MIGPFQGKWTKLSNYSICSIWYEGHIYQSVEHAFQAQKSLDPAIQKSIRDCPTPAAAKKLARSVQLRPDWEEVRVPIMETLLREKVSQEPEQSILLSTEHELLVELNWWHDNFWGNCTCPKCADIEGQNWLGRLLMNIRFELQTDPTKSLELAHDADDYQSAALKTYPDADHHDFDENLLLSALGLSGESGEFADIVKKYKFHHHPFTDEIRSKLVLELGDILWYVAIAAHTLGVTLSEVMQQNNLKLERRYPDGFSTEASLRRTN